MRRIAILVSLVFATAIPRLAAADLNDHTYLSLNSPAKNIALGTLLGVAAASCAGFVVWELKAADARRERTAMGDGAAVCGTSEASCLRYQHLFRKERSAMESSDSYLLVAASATVSVLAVQLIWPNHSVGRVSFAPALTPASGGAQFQARF